MVRTLLRPCRQNEIPVSRVALKQSQWGTGCADAPSFAHKVMLNENQVYKKVVVHQFMMADCDDPEIYVAQPIYEWQKSEPGTWCMEHALPESLTYVMELDAYSYGYRVAVIGHFREEDLVYFYLKWPINSFK